MRMHLFLPRLYLLCVKDALITYRIIVSDSYVEAELEQLKYVKYNRKAQLLYHLFVHSNYINALCFNNFIKEQITAVYDKRMKELSEK